MSTTAAELELRDAIEHLYRVFARYPLNATTDPCPHCYADTAAAEAPLHAKPLRKLSGETMRNYQWSALYTWGGVDDFRHFLPHS